MFHKNGMMDISIKINPRDGFFSLFLDRPMTDKSLMSEIGKRIQERLDFLEMSASAASLEAGLGRSALQDIITGKSKNPRLDTLRKLTGPLQCSLSFLTGDPPERLAKSPLIEWGEQLNEGENVHQVVIAGHVQAGNIRGEEEDDYSEYAPVIYTERDQRFPKDNLIGYTMLDRTQVHLNIQPGDILLAVAPDALKGSLRTGSVAIVERIIPHAFDAKDHTGTETTAREVQYVDNDLHLTLGAKTSTSKPIIISEAHLKRFAVGDPLERPPIRLVGVVVRVIREMPI